MNNIEHFGVNMNVSYESRKMPAQFDELVDEILDNVVSVKIIEEIHIVQNLDLNTKLYTKMV